MTEHNTYEMALDSTNEISGTNINEVSGNISNEPLKDYTASSPLERALKTRPARERMSGALVHPTSFPSPHGIGDLGKGAYDFIDFLHDTDQHLWQILPLGPTGFGDSPYQSLSAFACQTYIISPELLKEDGLLYDSDFEDEIRWNRIKVDYGQAIKFKVKILDKAYRHFCEQYGTEDYKNAAGQNAAEGQACRAWQKSKTSNTLEYSGNGIAAPDIISRERGGNLLDEFNCFRLREADWLETYAFFCAIKDYYDGKCWLDWDPDIRDLTADAIEKYKDLLSDRIRYYQFTQFLFDKQWTALRLYACKKDIRIIGDIPIFMAIDNCDVWANKKLFLLDSRGYPSEIAGVPPDYFSATGQLWGNPLYDWDYHKETGYDWWIRRIKRQLELVDYVRIDHFRGFVDYWSVPYGAKDAINGRWNAGPGRDLFRAMQERLGYDLPIIAEDLGIITESVNELRDEFGFPGMKVLQFGFGDMSDRKYMPHFYTTTNCVCYTGTHDNETTTGWYQHQSEEVRDRIRCTGNCDGSGVSLDFIRFAFGSIAKFAIFPIQDLLQLGNEGRMNTPGAPEDNWSFRYEQWQIDEEWRREWLRKYTRVFGRNILELPVRPTEN